MLFEVLKSVSRVALGGKQIPIDQVRFESKTKTRRSAYSRWRKTGTGYKHGIQGRNHGNAPFTSRILKKRTGTAESTKLQSKKMKKLMPFL